MQNPQQSLLPAGFTDPGTMAQQTPMNTSPQNVQRPQPNPLYGMLGRGLFALFLLLPSSLWATTTVTGKMQNLGAGNITSGAFMRFWLRGCAGNQPRVNGTGLIAPSQGGVFFFDIAADASGNVSGTLYSTRDAAGTGNGDIECGGSQTAVWYGMQAWSGGKSGPEVAVHAKNGASLDITQVVPITTNPVVVAPTGDSTYARLDGGNQPFLANITPNASGTLSMGTSSNRWKFFGTTLDLTGLASSTNALNINTTQQNTHYRLEVGNDGGYSQVRIGPSNADSGGYMVSSVSNNFTHSAGAAFDPTCAGATPWRAKETSFSDFHMGGLVEEWHQNSGLVAGNCFAPSNRMVLSGDQLQLNNATAAAPALTRLAESSSPGTGIYFLGDPGIGFSVCGAAPATCNSVGGAGVGQFKIITNILTPITDNLLDLGDTASGLRFRRGFFSSNIFVGTNPASAGRFACDNNQTCVAARNAANSADIALLQTDGSNNIFSGNGNANDYTLDAGSGRTIFLNKRASIAVGIAGDGSGFKHKRITTGSIGATTRTEVLLTWGTAFADANYTVWCAVEDSTTAAGTQGLTYERIRTHSASQVGAVINNPTAGGITGTLDCSAVHD